MVKCSKQVITVIFMVIFIGSIARLIVEATKPEILPLDSLLPPLEYIGKNGIQVLEPDTVNNTMIVLFHRKCEHCLYQLKQLNDHLTGFSDTNIFLLTTENKFFEHDNNKNWSSLTRANCVFWGIVKKNQVQEIFGIKVIPYIFIFNKSGRLFCKIKGKVRFNRILKILTVRNVEMSGYNLCSFAAGATINLYENEVRYEKANR